MPRGNARIGTHERCLASIIAARGETFDVESEATGQFVLGCVGAT
jgi:hypothetical protein